MNFLTLKPEAFGLDISDLSLKIIKLRKKGRRIRVVSFGEKEVKPGIIKEGEVIQKEELAEIIKQAMKEVKKEKLRTKYVVASLPEERAFFQVIQMPKISKEDLRSAIIYEAENYIPLPIEKVYLDFQIIPQTDKNIDHLDILICAIPRETVDPYFSSLKLAGLEPQSLEVESLAITRALIKDGVTSSPVLIIDFGATRTSFIIFSGTSLRFTSSISVSSMNFTEIISKSLGIDLNKAEKLKIKYGLEKELKSKSKKITKSTKERNKIFEALVPALVDLTQQIKKHLLYYQTHSFHEHLSSNGRKVSKILLCGGGSNLKGLKELLARELNLPVELGNPWINILSEKQKDTFGIPPEKSLGFTTALGLALRAIKENPFYD